MSGSLDRRELLRLGVLALGAAACATPLDVDLGEPSLGCTLEGLDAELAAAELGQAVLDGGEDPGAVQALQDEVGGDLERLRALHQADLEAGRLVRVDGWVLSRTEARWYAGLASLA